MSLVAGDFDVLRDFTPPALAAKVAGAVRDRGIPIARPGDDLAENMKWDELALGPLIRPDLYDCRRF